MTKVRRYFGGLFATLFLGLFAFTSLAEEARSMVDRDVLAAEVGRIDFLRNSSGEVIQIKVNECEQCDKVSYLPSSKFKAYYSDGTPVPIAQAYLNGYPGTIVLNQRTNMVLEVIFWSDNSGGAQ